MWRAVRDFIAPAFNKQDASDMAWTEINRLHHSLATFDFKERTEREDYMRLVREAMRHLADSIIKGGEVLLDTDTVYHVRTRDGKMDVRFVDAGTGRYWNLYVHTDGKRSWDACVIDAGAADRGIRFEICYDSAFIQTHSLCRLVRSHPGGYDVRLYTGEDDVGQQNDLTLPMVRDVLAHAARAHIRPDNVPSRAWAVFA